MKQRALTQSTSAGCEAAQSSQQICQIHVRLVKVVLGAHLLLAQHGQSQENANGHEKVTFSLCLDEGVVPSSGAFPNKRALHSSTPSPSIFLESCYSYTEYSLSSQSSPVLVAALFSVVASFHNHAGVFIYVGKGLFNYARIVGGLHSQRIRPGEVPVGSGR